MDGAPKDPRARESAEGKAAMAMTKVQTRTAEGPQGDLRVTKGDP